MQAQNSAATAMTAEIVMAFVSNNTLAASDMPGLIQSVHASISALDAAVQAAPERPEPAVAIRNSIKQDYIVCLEDGKKLKMLKRHLATRYNMTPEQYRERWGLPADYPMTAPAYVETRRQIAKDNGLGRKER
ncbi:MAG: MucR family transcriptional regulator [Novosphingobium sp.]|uniref:MucR family transcriptional regulator n=1 Tax=Novosphingobium sp. TaxID=1874826 RepID=UPI003B9CE7AE